MEEMKREYTSSERSPVIDAELRDLLPPITDEEREALTADILKNGCYSPMICMEDMTLVDGHHRYDICTEHDIPYRMVILDFEDKLGTMQWMVNTQKGRRNLTTYQLGLVAIRLKPALEARAKERMRLAEGGDRKSAEYQNQGIQKSENLDSNGAPVNTTKELAQQVGISHDTMVRSPFPK